MTQNTRYYRERRRKRVRFWSILARVFVVMVIFAIIGIAFIEILKMEQLADPSGKATAAVILNPNTAAQVAADQEEISELRRQIAKLETELTMTEGVRTELTEQVRVLNDDNAQLRSDLTYLQRLVAEATREAGVRIQDIRLTPGKRKNEWKYRILLVQGGNPKNDFVGNLRISAQMKDKSGNYSDHIVFRKVGKTDPNEPLPLKFKYYERLENSIFVPDGITINRLNVAVYKANSQDPLVTRSYLQ
jgi:hypothetical protein